MDLLDQNQSGHDVSSSQTYGAGTSLRQTGELDFNFREYDDYLDQFYRVRIDGVIHLNSDNVVNLERVKKVILNFAFHKVKP